MTSLEKYQQVQNRKLEASKLQSALSKFKKTQKAKNKKPKKVKTNKRVKLKKLSQKEKYKIFLKSDYWKEVRGLILIRDEFKCTRCNSKKKLQVHHLTYKNHNKEHLHHEDLITLCNNCHKKEHNINC